MQLSESGNDFTQQRQVEEITEKEQTIEPKADETRNFNESDSELEWVWNRQNKNANLDPYWMIDTNGKGNKRNKVSLTHWYRLI